MRTRMIMKERAPVQRGLECKNGLGFFFVGSVSHEAQSEEQLTMFCPENYGA